MMLFCGIPSEPPLALAIAAAAAAGYPHAVFNQRDSHAASIELMVRDGHVDGRLDLRDGPLELDRVTGVLTRLVEPASLPESRRRLADPVARRRAETVAAGLSEWLELTPARVLNRNAAGASNMSKPYQAAMVRRAGFRSPPTLLTNDPDCVRDFRRRHGRVVYKSISSVRSIVRELTDADDDAIARVRALPTQFQALVPGVDIRVHVVGERLFATEIASPAVDYRYAARDGLPCALAPTVLPPEVAQRCFALSRLLDLPLCGIDLKRTPEGDYYCFEANPSPAYSYFEELGGQPIARAIVDHLAGR
ncbi:MAG: alpha-L-glutamate ligase [Alphaproteobacteria bacterium]|nr:alpha-L-glutamate ligase [Alphaproteobacteria bacterium]